MKRLTPRARVALALILGLFAFTPRAEAAATVHRFNLEIGGGATQIAANNYNAQNEFINRAFIQPRGLDGFNAATMSFLFDVGFRFFLRPNIALRVNVGQMKTQDKREYLPAIRQDIQLRSEILSVPMQIGGDYYFAPYNQGDFQARAFVGGGILNTVENRVLFQSFESGTDNTTTLFGNLTTMAQKDSPGWYSEVGVHMFFAIRYSVVMNAYYRSAKTRGLVQSGTNTPLSNLTNGQPYDLDLSGIGGRAALCIGF